LLLVSREDHPLPNRLWNGKVSVPRRLDEWQLIAVVAPGDDAPVLAAAQDFSEQLPLDEPFERIRNAIDEAHAVTR
jgi:hypothetical protein